MADLKISQLDPLYKASGGAFIPVSDLSVTPIKSRKLTVQDLFAHPQPIGILTPSSGTFTTLQVQTSLRIKTGPTITDFSTDTSLGTSNNIIPTQRAIKTYVDNAVGTSVSNEIRQGDSFIRVIDTGTGYIEGAVDNTSFLFIDTTSINLNIQDSKISITENFLSFRTKSYDPPAANPDPVPEVFKLTYDHQILGRRDSNLASYIDIGGPYKSIFIYDPYGLSVKGNIGSGANQLTLNATERYLGDPSYSRLGLLNNTIVGYVYYSGANYPVLYLNYNTIRLGFTTAGHIIGSSSELQLWPNSQNPGITIRTTEILHGYWQYLGPYELTHNYNTGFRFHHHTTGSDTDLLTINQTEVYISNSLRLKNGIGVNEFSTDGTLSGNSNQAIPTERAVKTYVDAHSGGSGVDINLRHISSDTTAVGGDICLVDTTNGNITITLINGYEAQFSIKKISNDSNKITIISDHGKIDNNNHIEIIQPFVSYQMIGDGNDIFIL